MSTVLENVATEDALDQIVNLHEQAGDYLKQFRDTHRRMLVSLSTAFGGASAPIAAPAETKVAAKKAATPVAATASTDQRIGDNNMTLKQAVLNIFGRKENKKGLKVSQVIDIIEKEGIWKTDGNLDNMVHGCVYGLKNAGVVERGNDKVYHLKSK